MLLKYLAIAGEDQIMLCPHGRNFVAESGGGDVSRIFSRATQRLLYRVFCPMSPNPVKNLISQRCHGEIMIYSQLPDTITSLQHHFEAAHLTHHDINW